MEISTLVHEFFRLLNFAIFSGGAGWLFYRRVYPKIKLQMVEKDALDQKLKEQQEIILYQQKVERDERELQEQRIERLWDLAHQWRVAVEQKQKVYDQAMDTHLSALKQRYEKQQAIYMHKKMLQQKLPILFREAQEILERKYKNPDQAQRSLNSIIQIMKS